MPGLVAAHVILDDALWQDIVNLVKSGTKILGVFYAKEKAREKKVPGGAHPPQRQDGEGDFMCVATGQGRFTRRAVTW